MPLPDPSTDTQPPLFDMSEVPRLIDRVDFSRHLVTAPHREIETVADLDFERSRRRFAEGA